MPAEMTDANIDMSWADKGACKNEDPKLFYSDNITVGGKRTQTEAIGICNRCEVRINCLEYGLIYERHGIWGGMTEVERNKYRNKHNLRTHLDRFNIAPAPPKKISNAETQLPEES